MSKVLALDWGLKNTGAAIGEANYEPELLPSIPSPTREALINKISQIVKENSISEILIGLPVHQKNSQKVKTIAQMLEELGYKVILWEETLTSKQAEDYLKQLGYSQKSIDQKIHSASAALMLSEYLN